MKKSCNKPCKYLLAWATRFNNKWTKVNFPIEPDLCYIEDEINYQKEKIKQLEWSHKINCVRLLNMIK